MALIESFVELEAGTNKKHQTVTCGHRIFELDGERYLQLDTYGTSERQHQGKVSQSVQFDSTAARELLRLLKTAFPELTD